MDSAVLLIGVLTLGSVVVALRTVWRVDASVLVLRTELEALKNQFKALDARQEILGRNLNKILVPIHQTAEDIAELDHDLERLQQLYEELKKQEGSPPAAA